MGFPRQEYCSGLPLSSPEDLPDPGIEPGSPALQVDSLLSEPPGKPNFNQETANLSRQRGNGSFVQTHTLHAGAGRLCCLGQEVSTCCAHRSLLLREERLSGRVFSWQSEESSWEPRDCGHEKCRNLPILVSHTESYSVWSFFLCLISLSLMFKFHQCGSMD